MVRDGVNGFLVPTKDSGTLAVAIDRLLCSPVLREAVRIGGQKDCVAEFDQEVIKGQFVDVCVGLLGEEPRCEPVFLLRN